MQGYNGLKYFLTIVAVCMRTALSLNGVGGLGWKIIAWIFSVSAAMFGTYQDIVFDWGLLNWHSKNCWLRDKLLVPHKSVYFIGMVSNNKTYMKSPSRLRVSKAVVVISDNSLIVKLQDLNALLRFAWLQNVLNFNFTFLHRNTMITIVASLEIIRRSIWNFFRLTRSLSPTCQKELTVFLKNYYCFLRLENEHLSNVGKYRAFKSVPLPFNDDEDEEER